MDEPCTAGRTGYLFDLAHRHRIPFFWATFGENNAFATPAKPSFSYAENAVFACARSSLFGETKRQRMTRAMLSSWPRVATEVLRLAIAASARRIWGRSSAHPYGLGDGRTLQHH